MPWIDVAERVRADPPSKKEVEQVLDYRRRRAKARFYADENFPIQAVQVLRKMGCRVITAQEARRRGHPDENHAAYALKNGFILLTCDRDYLDERRFPLIQCPAIAFFDFGGGQPNEADIRSAFRCLRLPMRFPQFYDKWVKLDASRNSWKESTRFLDGSTSKALYRFSAGIHRGFSAGVLQEWFEG